MCKAVAGIKQILNLLNASILGGARSEQLEDDPSVLPKPLRVKPMVQLGGYVRLGITGIVE
jgi:hypothetical protein